MPALATTRARSTPVDPPSTKPATSRRSSSKLAVTPQVVTVAYTQEIVKLVTSGIEQRLAELINLGGDPREVLGEASAVAELMLSAVPATHAWDAQIGPFYDTPGVCRLLGISKQAVADRVRRRTILSGTSRQGRAVYPVFQFRGRHLVGAISEVAARFRDVPVDDWAVSAWFTTPAADLDGKTPARWLLDNGPVDPVRELAEQTVRRWA